MKLPIVQAKRIATELGADAVIVIAFQGSSFVVTSYGKDKPTCRAFADVCDQIHDDISEGVIVIPPVIS